MIRWFPAVAVLLVLLGSCSNSEPQVGQVFAQVNRHFDPESQRWSDALTVFVQVTNSDGLEVLSRMHILCDSAQLHWTLTPSTWTRVDRTGETWLGANHLTGPEGSLPTGAWRVQVATSAGLVAEQPFALPPEAPGTPAAHDGAVKLQLPAERTGLAQLSGFASDYLVWAYGDGGEMLGQLKATDSRFLLSAVVPGPGLVDRVRSLVFYSFDKERGEGIVAGPFTLK